MKYRVTDARTRAAAQAIFDEILKEIIALAPAYYSRTQQLNRKDPGNPEGIFVRCNAYILGDLVKYCNRRIYPYMEGDFCQSLNDLFKDLHHMRIALLKEMRSLEQEDEVKMCRLTREIDDFYLEAQEWEKEI